MAEDVRFKRGKKEVITGDNAVAVLDGCIYFTTDGNNKTTEMFVDMNGFRKQVVCGNGGGGTGGTIIVDQSYDANSENAQSGMAVSQAIYQYDLEINKVLSSFNSALASKLDKISEIDADSIPDSPLKTMVPSTYAIKTYVDNLIAGIGGGTGTLPDYYTSLIIKPTNEEQIDILTITPDGLFQNLYGSQIKFFHEYILLEHSGCITFNAPILDFSYANIIGIADPLSEDAPTNKKYVDDAIAKINSGEATLPDYFTNLIVKDSEEDTKYLEITKQAITSSDGLTISANTGLSIYAYNYNTFVSQTISLSATEIILSANAAKVSQFPATDMEIANKKYVDDIVTTAQQTFDDAETIALTDNTEYYSSTSISTLTITYPSEDFISSIIFTLAEEGEITITLPDATKYIGGTPNFQNGQTWELNIKNGVLVGGLIE